MLRTITDIKEWELHPTLVTNEKSYDTILRLWGNDWNIMDDYWMKHVHIKITDVCNAKCPFCIEKDSHVKNNFERLFENVRELLKQMDEQGHLTTISITGGEPSLFAETGKLVDLIKQEHPKAFLTINTNFSKLIDSKEDVNFLDISRHKIGVDEVCGFNETEKDFDELECYKKLHPNTKIRFQCVLHSQGCIKSVEDFNDYVDYYGKYADDISIRRLITTDRINTTDLDLYDTIRMYLKENAELQEQVLKDYYVYETWAYKGTYITFSHSNMGLLKSIESTEKDSVIREIIVHPDGLISGSWYRDKKIIKE